MLSESRCGKSWADTTRSLHTNEDYDFNYRVRRSGRQVILDRARPLRLFCSYDVKSLASQYLRYGGWKAEMIRLHPRSIKLRHLVAPVFVASILVLAIAGYSGSRPGGYCSLKLSRILFARFVAGCAGCEKVERRFGNGSCDAFDLRNDSFDLGLEFSNSIIKSIKEIIRFTYETKHLRSWLCRLRFGGVLRERRARRNRRRRQCQQG